MSTRRALRIAALLVVLGVAVLTLKDKLPDPAQIAATIASASPWWLVLAAAAEMTSLRHFALQQRRLLAGFGVRMSVPRAVAVTFTRSAISFSLPAGSAMSAGFAFRQFRTAGASRRTAGAVAVLSSLLSGVALLLMYGAVVLIPRGGATGNADTLVLVIGLLVTASVVFGLDFLLSRRPPGPVAEDLADDDPPPGPRRGLIERGRASVARTVADLRRLPPRSWVLSLVHATVNWGLDFACLAATAAAFDIDVSPVALATVYLTVQLVRQVPISPGGIGVVEVALLAGLVSAGAAHGPAAAAMLVYRLLSCWIIIPLGALAYATLRGRKAPAPEPARPQPTPVA
ncbi:flippase-like domain-containing protein [Dactylosporangium aurantiacum]|uniref:Flippase-like domain-containing protein n=1 Tax=Dactylosporangium aurantiacum TaxID=35754 RepID=A0A9Q9ICW8_9ACTN|nr:lysylphosphatidylglycerol synthase transmembrane domain-containing protein [Dactylosporangium aurantiacum]MDG6103350.1 lysylphosphatidylglycerol synthase transmembrane domain-containing protein [Dactylosporangium aurantiacum]UWZ52128.1 flippase-like domain-containing protein [Dactylosporangium aurantiacum]